MPAAVSRQLISFGPFEFDPTSGLLFEGDQETLLPPKAAGVLRALLECAGALVTKDRLLESVWAGSFVTESSLTDAVSALRHELGDDPQEPTYIQTVHRRGYRFIADVKVERAGEETTGGGATTGISASNGSRIPQSVAVGLAVIVLVAGAFLTYKAMRPAPSEARPTRYLSTGLSPAPSPNWERRALALSPDGTQLAYSAGAELYLRPMDELEATEIQETSPEFGTSWGAASPFFSRGRQQLGYYQDDRLMRRSLDGGVPVSLCIAADLFGASWGPDDDSIVYGQGPEGIWRVSAHGGEPRQIIRLEPGQSAHGPEILPGGEWMLFTLKTGSGPWDDAQIVAQSLETERRLKLIDGGTDARYVPTGHLVYARQEALYAVAFDPKKRLEITGDPVMVVEGVQRSVADVTGAAHFSFSRTGDLVYLTPRRAVTRLYWIDREGHLTPLTEKEGLATMPRLSPDGQRVAAWVRDDTGEHIWIYEIGLDSWQPLTTVGSRNRTPRWSPDGHWVVFSSDRLREEQWNLYRKRADFSGPAEVLLNRDGRQWARGLSPDGKLIPYSHSSPTVDPEVWILHLDDEPWSEPLLQNPAEEGPHGFSPDGKWIAYRSDRTGRVEAYVQAHPGSGGGVQISNGGAGWLEWSPKGQEVFYWRPRQMMVVNVQTDGPVFGHGPPRLLFDVDDRIAMGQFSVTPDGQRFLAYGREEAGASPQINVVTNWFEELKRNVPTGR